MSGVALTGNAYRDLAFEARHAEDGNETGGLLLGYDLGMSSGFVVRFAEILDRMQFASRRTLREISRIQLCSPSARLKSMVRYGSANGTLISSSCPCRVRTIF